MPSLTTEVVAERVDNESLAHLGQAARAQARLGDSVQTRRPMQWSALEQDLVTWSGFDRWALRAGALLLGASFLVKVWPKFVAWLE